MLQIGRSVTIALIYCLGASGTALLNRSETKSTPVRTIQRVVHLAPPGTKDSRYAYVAFDVPAHASRINVSYEYERANQTNVIDIGLFDARSRLASDPSGFRGWSGGRRSKFFVSLSDATPGYLPGAMPAGTWRVILGLYRVAPSGVDVSLKIEIETAASGATTAAQLGSNAGFTRGKVATPVVAGGQLFSSSDRQRPGGKDLRWWRGDLHMHTVHSDGDWTVSELITNARKTGLDFICITDHNTSSHHPEIDRALISSPPLVLRGEEITTYGGHANAWGLESGTWIDFRSRPGDKDDIARIAAQVHRAGALISINHPFGSCGGCSWSYDPSARGFDGIEVWNGVWDQIDEQALKMWDKILQSGRQITAIASSDSHRATNPIGQPTTNVAAPILSQRALLDAVRRGRVYLTTEVLRTTVRFEAERRNKRLSRWMIGDEAHLGKSKTIRFFISADGLPPDATISLISNGQVIRQLLARADGPIEIECLRDSYFRVEVRDKTKSMLVLTNPIYVRITRPRE